MKNQDGVPYHPAGIAARLAERSVSAVEDSAALSGCEPEILDDEVGRGAGLSGCAHWFRANEGDEQQNRNRRIIMT
jgi:hypothetical protein